jgi:BlaI family transcriptional regulator, penicillinase repressor
MSGKGRSPQQLTPLELQIMNVLWDCGPSNVQSVQEKLTAPPKLAYTTVQTMLNVLHRKGRVRRRLRGRAFEYVPVLTREKAASNAIGDMINRLFGGSVDGLLMSLVKSQQLDPRKLQELSGLVEEHERGKKGKGHASDE